MIPAPANPLSTGCLTCSTPKSFSNRAIRWRLGGHAFEARSEASSISLTFTQALDAPASASTCPASSRTGDHVVRRPPQSPRKSRMELREPTKHIIPRWSASTVDDEPQHGVVRLFGHHRARLAVPCRAAHSAAASSRRRSALRSSQNASSTATKGATAGRWRASTPASRRHHLQILPTRTTMTTTLSDREDARRVRRSIRTINRWRKAGMPMSWELRHGQHVRVVDEDVLVARWRDRLDANPAHQRKLRRLAETERSRLTT